MAYLILTFLTWWYLPSLCDDVYGITAAIGAQVLLHLWLFAKTWTEYLAVMNLKRNQERMPPTAMKLAKPIAINGVIDDIIFRITWGPLLLPGVSPIPKNKHDWLMTGLLHRIKSTHPVNSWLWKRADFFCRTWLDENDPDRDHC